MTIAVSSVEEGKAEQQTHYTYIYIYIYIHTHTSNIYKSYGNFFLKFGFSKPRLDVLGGSIIICLTFILVLFVLLVQMHVMISTISLSNSSQISDLYYFSLYKDYR